VEQSNRMEKIQKHTLVTIFSGLETPYSEVFIKLGLVSLEQRRQSLSIYFWEKKF
jgi:hypothetical protein